MSIASTYDETMLVVLYSVRFYVLMKTDVVFLEREIRSRKQQFGVEVYDLMAELEVDTGMSMEEKEAKIRLAFDKARKDIAVIQAKIECKKEEIVVLQEESDAALAASAMSEGGDQKPTLSGTNQVSTTGHPGDVTEMEHGITN